MNKCTDVFDAEKHTGHEYSIGVQVPDNDTLYIKGTSKDEIRRYGLRANNSFICIDKIKNIIPMSFFLT